MVSNFFFEHVLQIYEIIFQDVIDDNFDIGQYAQLWRTTNESKEKQTKIKSKVFAVKENMNEKNSQEMDKKVKPKKGT